MSPLSQPAVKQELSQALYELGLTEHECDLYILSLTLGPMNIASLAVQLGISRPNVYKVVAGLERRGLARHVPRQTQRQSFMVEPPTKVTKLLRQKRERMTHMDASITQSMPELLGLYQQGHLPTSIKILDGKEAFLETFFSILDEEREETQFLGSADEFVRFVTWAEERQWIQKRMQRGIRVKCLLTPGPDAHLLHKDETETLREVRILTHLDPFVSSFQIYANKVILWQPRAPIGILLEDQYIVAMLRSIFFALWKASAYQPPNLSPVS